MFWLDWWLVGIPLFIVLYIGLKTQKYVKGVADFLTAGRVAGRYVVAVASGEAALGLVSVIAIIEMYYNSGFAISYWNSIVAPMTLLFALFGYCTYRFRETRAMTMGQFLEMRYNRSFRIFAAILQSISGIINYAIFPAVGARFMIYYLDLPLKISLLGWPFPTFGLLMAIFLGMALVVALFGGQITIMVTDCVQGILSYPMYVVIVGYIIYRFNWFDEIAPTLLDRPPGQSFLNPFDIHNLRNFNAFYIFVGIFASVINRMAWCGTQGYNTAAATPHEQKMGGLLGTWRGGFSVMMYVLLAVAAYTYLNNAHFKNDADKVHRQLAAKTVQDVTMDKEKFDDVRENLLVYAETGVAAPELAASFGEAPDQLRARSRAALDAVDPGVGQTFNTIYGQMLVPVALREILPMGITGIFCAVMIFLMISTDTTYMHSWGSIVIQDLVLPLRKKAFTPHQQLKYLRFSIAGVAAFAFFFSFFFSQIDFILMFFSITGAIWLGGAGPCIVFGLYWKRGTTAGAFGALISGSSLAVAGLICQKLWAPVLYPWIVEKGLLATVTKVFEGLSAPFNPYIVWKVTPGSFPVNSQEIYFIAMIVALTLYISLSLLTCKRPFNMDRMLHRGAYRTEGGELRKTGWTFRNLFSKIIGIDSQYTWGDKVLAWSVFIWSFVYSFCGCFFLSLVWNLISPWPASWWANYFLVVNLIVPGIVACISTVWFTIGGTMDLIKLFKRLEAKQENVLDDGRVVGHVSLADLELVENVEQTKIAVDSIEVNLADYEETDEKKEE